MMFMILGFHPLHDDGCLLDEWYFTSLPRFINGLDFQEVQSRSHPELVRGSPISLSKCFINVFHEIPTDEAQVVSLNALLDLSFDLAEPLPIV
jgi:hypothetical protein